MESLCCIVDTSLGECGFFGGGLKIMSLVCGIEAFGILTGDHIGERISFCMISAHDRSYMCIARAETRRGLGSSLTSVLNCSGALSFGMRETESSQRRHNSLFGNW